jgi:hypothetical protein
MLAAVRCWLVSGGLADVSYIMLSKMSLGRLA